MITHPTTEELVKSVALWIDQIRPSLDPRNAFLARVAANALATVGRELSNRPGADAEAERLMVRAVSRPGVSTVRSPARMRAQSSVLRSS